METELLLNFEPSELNFPFELNKQLPSAIRLLNKTDKHVAFKLLSTNRRNYVVRPRIGILSPGSSCDITVTMRAMREAPHNMKCKDKFMIQSAVATLDATSEDARKMFDKEAGHVFQECKLRVAYSKPTESSSGASVIENPDSHVPQVNNSVEEPHDNDLQVNNSVEEPHDNDLQTSTRKLLDVKPSELQFPLNPNKELSCSIQLSNLTEHHVAFRVTASSKYFVQPNIGIISPRSTYDITVRKQAQVKASCEIQNDDKFLIQSVVAPAAATTEGINLAMVVSEFDKERLPTEECDLQVVHISKQENNRNCMGELVLTGIIVSLLGFASLYLMKQTLSWIWSLTMIAIMLMVKMIKKLVSDSVEDWIVKTLLYIVMHFVFRRKNNIDLS